MALPVILRVLDYLEAHEGPEYLDSIAMALNEPPPYIEEALRKLEGMEVVTAVDGGHAIVPGPRVQRLLAQLVQVYSKVDVESKKELLLRGYICQIPKNSLFHMDTLLGAMEREGLDLHEVTAFLNQESSRKHIKTVYVVYQASSEPLVLPICITPFHLDRLQKKGAVLCWEHETLLKREDHDGGQEGEVYILSQYPAHISRPAEEYLRHQRRDLNSSLRRMGVVGWHGWWWRLKRKERPNWSPTLDKSPERPGAKE